MRYHIEWAYLAEDNLRVLYDEVEKNWSLTFPQAISLARRMGAKKYGDWILYDPKLNKNTYLLWFLPLLIFLIGGAIIFKKLIKEK